MPVPQATSSSARTGEPVSAGQSSTWVRPGLVVGARREGVVDGRERLVARAAQRSVGMLITTRCRRNSLRRNGLRSSRHGQATGRPRRPAPREGAIPSDAGRILTILNEQVASPNEIAEMLDERLPNVSYHVRALLDLGCIELVGPRSAAARSSTTTARSCGRSSATATGSGCRARGGRRCPTWCSRSSGRTCRTAIKAGTFEGRTDRHLTRSRCVLDEQGWSELNKYSAGARRGREDRVAERGSAQEER